MRFCYLCFLTLSLHSCTKKEYQAHYDKEAPTFFISGLKNFQVEKNPLISGRSDFSWPVFVNYTSDTPRRIHLEVAGQNPKLKCSLIGENDAYPSFISNIVLHDSGGTNGLYNFKLLVQKEGDSVQQFPFQITLSGSRNCAQFLSGLQFLGYSWGYLSRNYFNIRTSIPTPGSDTLVIHHLKGDISLVTIPDCSNYSVHIPPQQIGDTIYSGAGVIKNSYANGGVNLELDVLEEAGIWGATMYYIIGSR